MGKALVIKGADFSQVKIRQIDVDAKFYLTKENALFSKNGYISGITHLWVSAQGTTSLFWPVSQGDIVIIDGEIPVYSSPSKSTMYFCTIENDTPIYQDYFGIRTHKNNRLVGICPTNGFICSIVYDTYNTEEFVVDLPAESFRTADQDYLSILQINRADPVFTYPGYFKSNNTWGTEAVTGFWPVLKGETVKISTLQNKGAIVALFKSGIRNNNGVVTYTSDIEGGTVVINIDGSNRQVLAANTVTELIMPETGYLAIQMIDGTTECFPANIEIEL